MSIKLALEKRTPIAIGGWEQDNGTCGAYSMNGFEVSRYLRIQPPELKKAHLSSAHRHRTVDKYPKPERRTIIEDILSDQSDPEYSIFRTKDIISVVTVAVGKWQPSGGQLWLVATNLSNFDSIAGIFDISNRQWSIYTEPPNKSGPVAVLPIIF